MPASIQDNTGLKKALTVSRLYEFFQNLLGGDNSRKWIAEEVWRLRGDEKVVDIGCGPGSSLSYLPKSVEYFGIDLSEAYIDTARKTYGDRGTFIVGTAQDFTGNSDPRLNNADVVLCNGLLHHLCDAEALEVLELSRKILKSGGRLICLEATFLRRQTRISKWIVSRDRGKYVRSEQEWKKLIETVFDFYSTSVLTGLIRIPYTHIVIECFNQSPLRRA
jgi:ubiquinone/menaquinone biosynthesis C-methylase UbiE